MGEWFYYNFAVGTFHTKNLVGDYSIELECCLQKRQIRFFETPFGGVRGNVRTSSIARWKERCRRTIRDN